MDPELSPTPYRFTRDVSPSAPKPGHHLATASFQLGEEEVILWVVEGPENDAFGFKGMATDFRTTRMLKFSLHGTLIERLNELPPSPYDRSLQHCFRSQDSLNQEPAVNVAQAVTVFSGLRAPGRIDPDSAAVEYRLHDGERVLTSITGYQRGWLLAPVIASVGVSLWPLTARPSNGQEIWLTIEQDSGGMAGRFQVSGAVAYRDSIKGS